ncbi:AAA family ATPase [Agrobacterium rhizogenes]|nr:AAA family ATPase [Rhizobium rhizogenes]
MKLISARFENFRLLRDLRIDFSTDEDKNLTVIRAENETGKTTILTALQWAFYGDEILPGDPRTYRLHPIDWQDPVCPVAVEVDIEVLVTTRFSDVPTRKVYRLVRSASEYLHGSKWDRRDALLEMYEFTDNGTKPVANPENRVRTELPPELREVFFTDGDRALSFIEADSMSVKRNRVESAIKALLGLSIVEDAGKHVKAAAADVNRQVKETDVSERARLASSQVEQLDGQILAHEEQIAKASGELQRAQEFDERLTRQIEDALKLGDRAELAGDLQGARVQRKRMEQQETATAREMAELLKDRLLARQLLSGHIEKAAGLLDKLKEEGRIPNQTIPVLVERLREKRCICGENLTPGDHDCERRRTHIEGLIETSRNADAMQTLVTELYFGARELMAPVSQNGWTAKYVDYLERRKQISRTLTELRAKEAQLDARIATVPDVDIQALKDERKSARRTAEEQSTILSRAQAKREAGVEQRRIAAEQLTRYLKEEGKGNRLRSELLVSQDVLRVFDRAMGRLKSDEILRVSELMNAIFLQMIGADPEQGAIIRRASVSQEFDILVWGPDDRILNPDRDLNGASRRALTIAFILALTRVSEVEAPNIIDTPLGMMSGYVKASVLRSTIKHSAQLILLLTRSEIAGTENTLKEFAGSFVTLTNPAHYPRMLLNEPKSKRMQVIRCDCGYDETCNVCARRMDVVPVAIMEESA